LLERLLGMLSGGVFEGRLVWQRAIAIATARGGLICVASRTVATV